MSIDPCLEWLYGTGMAVFVRENELAFPWIEGLHVLAITLVVGSIAVVDLRLLGLASRDRPVAVLTRDTLPITWAAFAVAVATGLVLFASNATHYAVNPFFRLKLVLLAVAGANMLYFQLWVSRRLADWSAAPRPPWPARAAGAISLATWIAVVAAGRWIGFTMVPGS